MESEFSTTDEQSRSETTSIGDWANHQNDTKMEHELVREESIAVRRTKFTVFLMIFLAGVGGTFVTYYMVKQSEYQDFSDDVSGKSSLIYELPFGPSTIFATFSLIPSQEKLRMYHCSQLRRHLGSFGVLASLLQLPQRTTRISLFRSLHCHTGMKWRKMSD
jgi:hypothetical protein